MNSGIKIAGILTGIIVAAFLALTLSLDGIVKSQVEDTGSELLQTEVSIDDLDISLFNGSGEIENFTVGNPEGFSDDNALQFGQIEMKVNLGSLWSDRVIVEELIIKNPVLLAEQEGSNINLKQLSDRMNSSGSSNSEQEVVIEYLRIESGVLRYLANVNGEQSGETNLSTIELENIGAEQSNTLQQVMQKVLQPLLQEAASDALRDGVMDQVEDAVNDLLGG